MLGGFTVTPIARELLLALLSGYFCVAINVWPFIARPAVYHVIVRVALAPGASPGMVCVPIVTPAVASVSTTSKLAVASWPPTFCTLTTTGTVSPCVTALGAVRPLKAMSAGGVVIVTVAERWLL